MSHMTTFAEELRAVFVRTGPSTAFMATRRAALSEQTVRALLSGASPPTSVELHTLAAALCVTGDTYRRWIAAAGIPADAAASDQPAQRDVELGDGRAPATFAETLRRLRLARGLSLTRLAARTGCDHSLLSRYESGARMPSRLMLERLSTALALPEDERERLFASAGMTPGPGTRAINRTGSASASICAAAERVADASRAGGQPSREALEALIAAVDVARTSTTWRAVGGRPGPARTAAAA